MGALRLLGQNTQYNYISEKWFTFYVHNIIILYIIRNGKYSYATTLLSFVMYYNIMLCRLISVIFFSNNIVCRGEPSGNSGLRLKWRTAVDKQFSMRSVGRRRARRSSYLKRPRQRDDDRRRRPRSKTCAPPAWHHTGVGGNNKKYGSCLLHRK